MKLIGKISAGAYKGQPYYIVRPSVFPRWGVVHPTDENGHTVLRSVREKYLEKE